MKPIDPKINIINISGRLANDPTIKNIGNTQAVNFTLANDKGYFDKSHQWVNAANFVNIQAFGEFLVKKATYLVKGQLVVVEGRLDIYTDEKDGQKRNFTSIKANKIMPLTRQEASQQPENDIFGNESVPF